MRRSFLGRLIVVILVLVGLGTLFRLGAKWMSSSDEKINVGRNTILHLDLTGVILNGKKFLKNLHDYRDEKDIKAILININSPGGAVGPSQEIFTEIKRFREEIKKPVVCVSTGIMASGAYYSAVACDKIVVAPGALVGSIGVIMEFANLEKLYDWAKISRYSITSGKYKDSGAEYRPMRDDERALFQNMISEVYKQFRDTVKESRHLKDEVLNNYADGRVFTGAKAVEMGFADQVGTYQDAVALAAQLAGLGADYEIFEIPKKKRTILDIGGGDEDDPINSFLSGKINSSEKALSGLFHQALMTDLLNQPLYLMPGYWSTQK